MLCEGPDSNRRTPARTDPKSVAFDLARQPSHRGRQGTSLSDLLLAMILTGLGPGRVRSVFMCSFAFSTALHGFAYYSLCILIFALLVLIIFNPDQEFIGNLTVANIGIAELLFCANIINKEI